MVEKKMPEPRKFQAGSTSDWPNIHYKDGTRDRADLIPPAKTEPYCDLAYLTGFEHKAYYLIENPEMQVGFKVQWDAAIFKWLWYWQERYATQDAPWWGNAYAIGLEPWTTKYDPNPAEAIKRGEFIKIGAAESISTELSATAFST